MESLWEKGKRMQWNAEKYAHNVRFVADLGQNVLELLALFSVRI